MCFFCTLSARDIVRFLLPIPRPRAGLLENQRSLLALAQPVGDTGLFLCLELGGKRQKLRDLLRRKIKQL